MPNSDMRPIPNPGVVGKVVEDEAVLILPESGEIKVLNAVGARAWLLANGSRSVSEIAVAIAMEYNVSEVQAEQDIIGFFRELARHHIVSWPTSPGSG